MLHVFYIGQQVAGLPGALVAGLGMFGPTSLMLAIVASFAVRPHPPAWVKRFHAACGPITIGLMAAAAWSIGQNMLGNVFYVAVGLAAGLLVARRLLDPAWIVLLAAALGGIQAFLSA